MRKFIVLSLVGLLVLAFGTMVYAQAKEEAKLNFMASGMFQMRSDVWRWNSNSATSQAGILNVVPSAMVPGGAGWDRHNAYMEGRGRLKFDAIMGKEVSGTIFLEIDSTLWGDTPGATGYTNRASALTVSERGSFGYWTGDRAAVEVKNVYIDVLSVPFMPVPTSLRIGLQGHGWRTNILGGSDSTGITATIKVDPITLQPVWYKAVEGVTYTADDSDLYGLNVFGKYETFTIGAYGLFFNMNTYPFWVTQDATFATVPSGVPNKLGISVQGTLQAEAWWLGFYTDGKAGPVDINFDLAYSHAKVKSILTPTVDAVKYSGWATRLKVDYPWEKFNFGTVLAYGSGADAKKTSKTGLPGETTVYDAAAGTTGTATKVKSYVNLPSGESGAFSESEVFFASYCNDGNTGIGYSNTSNALGRGSIGGIWLAKLYASAKATPWYKVTLQGLYIGDTTKNGDTFGTSRSDATTLRNEKTIGWELDMINEFQIYKSLSYRVGLGFLVPGKALRFYESATKLDEKPKTPWIFTTMLWYTF